MFKKFSETHWCFLSGFVGLMGAVTFLIVY